MVKIGWLADQVGIVGGAEISGDMLTNAAPGWAEIVFCPCNRRPPDDIDLWVLQNSITYDIRWTEPLSTAPIVKHFRDGWHPGDPVFRRWVLDHVSLQIFSSRLAIEHTPWPCDAPVRFVPPPVDLDAFRRGALPPDERRGNIFVGRVDYLKGAHRAVDWALRNDERVDFYGTWGLPWSTMPEQAGTWHGPEPYTALPQIYGAAKRFVFLPSGVESFSRTTVEAWAAGCDLVIDESKIGALEWIDERPEDLEMDRAIFAFWEAIREVI